MPIAAASLPCRSTTRTTTRRAVVTAVAVGLAACGRSEESGARSSTPRDTVVVVAPARPIVTTRPADTAYRLRPGYVVDSVLPPAEALRRFRAGLPRPAALAGGAPSREALVRRFLTALTSRDTAALARMALTRAEFAWLVYPSSPLSLPPYRQPPGIVWLQLEMGGRPGLRRLLERLGGQRLAYTGHMCDPSPTMEGENRLWRHCRVTYVRAQGDTVRAARLFGVVVERGGAFKFANYASDF